MRPATPQDSQTDRVPAFPFVRLELREEAGGTWMALLDGHSVYRGGAEEGARAAVLAAAGERAVQRPMQAIRARLTGFGADAGDGVVTADGTLVIAAEPTQPRSRKGLVLAAGLVVVVLGSAGALAWAVFSTPRTAPNVVPVPSPTQLPVVPPAGFSAVAAWGVSVPAPGLAGASGQVASGMGLVFVPAADGGSVVALDAAAGVERWRTPMPSSTIGLTITGGPVWVAQGAQAVVMAWSGDRVVAFDPTSGRLVQSWELPSGTAQMVAYPGGVVAASSGRSVRVFTPAGMAECIVPAGASVVGLTADGKGVVAVGQSRVWQVTSPRIAGDGTPLPAPEGFTLQGALGVSGTTLALAWAPTSGTSTLIQAVDLTTAKQSWAARVTGTPFVGLAVGNAGALVTPSQLHQPPRGGWSVMGPVLTDAHGKLHLLPQGWTTTAISSRAVYGSTSLGTGVATPDGKVRQTTSTVLQGSTVAAADEAGHTFMVATNGSTSALYALRPQTGAQR